MSIPSSPVEHQYGRQGVLDAILDALGRMGREPGQLVPADLAPVDSFHIRGREATVELADRAALKPGMAVLDVGCGLGGSARYLASQYGCHVTGIDLTRAYLEAARRLTELVGLDDRVEFCIADALNLPFKDAGFDVVWTEHTQMNIADKAMFYGEIARVLTPGGQLLLHDVFAGEAGPLRYYPVPWADDPSISFLAPAATVRQLLEDRGLMIDHWIDTSDPSQAWFLKVLEMFDQTGPPPLGPHLLMGDNARLKIENQLHNLREGRLAVVQAVARRH